MCSRRGEGSPRPERARQRRRRRRPERATGPARRRLTINNLSLSSPSWLKQAFNQNTKPTIYPTLSRGAAGDAEPGDQLHRVRHAAQHLVPTARRARAHGAPCRPHCPAKLRGGPGAARARLAGALPGRSPGVCAGAGIVAVGRGATRRGFLCSEPWRAQRLQHAYSCMCPSLAMCVEVLESCAGRACLLKW
jgi:hypothetical protein